MNGALKNDIKRETNSDNDCMYVVEKPLFSPFYIVLPGSSHDLL